MNIRNHITKFLFFIKQSPIKQSSYAFLAMLVISIISLAAYWSKIPPQVPLYYSLPWGEQQLASPVELTLLPTLATNIFLTNLLLVYALVPNEKLLVRIGVLGGLFSSGLLFYTFLNIIFLVT
ncbi:hypothetical protein COW99_01150 [Candidatus Roizmanbacteria bacterium CG22_combo_CG10-13_8_21_14_all_38_20]|uniref:DUF1648 domain-containing protein n=1 Tax=Candidatus Roizmanbacteria bacterium CG22_combo_CG10-13_8_21_14_all_38_20 TaxID=1974862 RepID=A0A2H0BWS0_9BACT|nr:hypothetical protein [Candidatus Microgenomates bacterium]PIP61989.1 MAG: hypothetical protein COW99_01150 [Candidatus Roizmanbacteria bacterium CG22_combo_CG10-13_8_21_14_all_38_20]PJC31926.1 MAG: hypothetical protein CO050_01800 [Candidatus Roizmanbacteria bacterium CG_4_9_14_0_2_um_filter_38_17]